MLKNPPANAGNVKVVGSTPGLERYPIPGEGMAIHYSQVSLPGESHGLRSLVGYSP